MINKERLAEIRKTFHPHELDVVTMEALDTIEALLRVAVAADDFFHSLRPMNQKGHDELTELKESLQALRGKV